MTAIVTLTLNPAIDISSEAAEIRHTRKIRTSGDRLEPGGGGINVARALSGFGAPVQALYLAGGPTGAVLEALLERHGTRGRAIPISGDTRVSLTVVEKKTGLEYRFVPEGPCITADECHACLDAVRTVQCEYFVASGSLAECLPDSFYAELAAIVVATGARLVLDTSGPELTAALRGGGIYLIKPSRGELETLVGAALASEQDIAHAAMSLVSEGAAEQVAVTLGEEGALLANSEGVFALAAVSVDAVSAVGAGDSFLAGMTFALWKGLDPLEALRMGIAAGAAAVQSPGTELCRYDAVMELLPQVPAPRKISL